MSNNVSKENMDKVNELKSKILSGEIKINTTYTGLEFYPKTGEFVDQSYKYMLKKDSSATPTETFKSNIFDNSSK